ncbi:hypothetical protein cypCar_00004491, partial [Cyprinus carpio]
AEKAIVEKIRQNTISIRDMRSQVSLGQEFLKQQPDSRQE